MSTKTIGYVLIIAGIVVFAVALFADALGIGSASHQFAFNQIGLKQWLGVVVGVIIAVVGGYLSMRK